MVTAREHLANRIALLNKEKQELIDQQTTEMSQIEAKVEAYRVDLTKNTSLVYSSKIEKKDIEIAALQASLDSIPND